MREFFFFANIPYELDDENEFPSFAEYDMLCQLCGHMNEHLARTDGSTSGHLQSQQMKIFKAWTQGCKTQQLQPAPCTSRVRRDSSVGILTLGIESR